LPSPAPVPTLAPLEGPGRPGERSEGATPQTGSGGGREHDERAPPAPPPGASISAFFTGVLAVQACAAVLSTMRLHPELGVIAAGNAVCSAALTSVFVAVGPVRYCRPP
jgi:hypothetical protein